MKRYLWYELNFLKVQIAVMVIVSSYGFLTLLSGEPQALGLLPIGGLMALTLINYVLFKLDKTVHTTVFVVILTLHLLVLGFMIYSDILFLAGIGVSAYILFSLKWFMTFCMENIKKQTVILIITIPILLAASIMTVHAPETGKVIFALALIFILMGIYRVVQQLHDRFVDQIDNQDAVIDETKSMYAHIEKSQEKLKQVYEEMSEQKFKLEKNNKKLERMTAEMYMQNELLMYISKTLEIDELMDLVTDSIIGAIGTDSCGIILENGNFHGYDVEAKSTYDNEATMHLLHHVKKGRLQPYIHGNKVIVDPNVSIENYPFMSHHSDTYKGSLVLIPICHDGAPYGVLYAEHQVIDFFNPSTVEFMKAIATQVDIAVQNATLYQKMEDMARLDALTGLYNRTAFMTLLSQLLASDAVENNSVSVILCDIDYFKPFNETHGHLAGDAGLKMIGAIIKAYAVDLQALTCRYGGEQFVLVVPGKTVEQTYGIMSFMHEEIQATPFYDGNDVYHLDMSMGITAIESVHETPLAFLARAEAAMIKAKEKGRARIEIQ